MDNAIEACTTCEDGCPVRKAIAYRESARTVLLHARRLESWGVSPTAGMKEQFGSFIRGALWWTKRAKDRECPLIK